jgi:hypothetical protein
MEALLSYPNRTKNPKNDMPIIDVVTINTKYKYINPFKKLWDNFLVLLCLPILNSSTIAQLPINIANTNTNIVKIITQVLSMHHPSFSLQNIICGYHSLGIHHLREILSLALSVHFYGNNNHVLGSI